MIADSPFLQKIFTIFQEGIESVISLVSLQTFVNFGNGNYEDEAYILGLWLAEGTTMKPSIYTWT